MSEVEKQAREEIIEWFYSMVDETIQKPNSFNYYRTRFPHKNLPANIDLAWLQTKAKMMLEQMEIVEAKGNLVYVVHRSYTIEQLEARRKLLKLVIGEETENQEAAAQLLLDVEEEWKNNEMDCYPKEWDTKVTETMNLGELMAILYDKHEKAKHFPLRSWETTMQEVAAETGLSIRQVENRLKSLLLKQGWTFINQKEIERRIA